MLDLMIPTASRTPKPGIPTYTDAMNLNTTRCIYNTTILTETIPITGYITLQGCEGGRMFQQYNFDDFEIELNPVSISK